MELIPPSDDTLRHILRSVDLDVQQHRRDTETLRQWLRSQPHLPHDLDDNLLGSFIVGCKNSLERAKQSLERYLCNRTSCPDFYQHRDPCDPAFRKTSRIIRYMPLPSTTPEGYRVSVFSMSSPDVPAEEVDIRYMPLPSTTPEGYRVSVFSMSSPDVPAEDVDLRLNAIKVLCSYDVRFLEDSFWAGDVIVLDCRNFTLKHLPALAVIPLLKKYTHCVSDTLPVRFKKIIFINLSPVVEKVLSMVKPLLKPKISQRIIASSEDHRFLYNHIPRDILPDEYGGNAGTLEELNDSWQLKVESYRDWFLKDMNRKVDENLRPDKSAFKSKVQLFGVEGSFKTLSID